MAIKRAERKRINLKLGLSGPSGSGKTYSALLMAYGIVGDWSKICVLDTENESSNLYADLGEYGVLPMAAPYAPERFIKAIKYCADEGVEVLIMDSISHEWDGEGGCLDIHGNMTGNSFANWKKITPRHKAFTDAILHAPIHVITTTRRKQSYEITEENGKKKVQKMGTQEVQRDGFEYELTSTFSVDMNHKATINKDRTSIFIPDNPFLITIETGQTLKRWAEGERVEPASI